MKLTDAICLLIPVLCFASAKCPSMKFGAMCRYRCHCANDGICYDVTGECLNGCARAWSGENCQKNNIALEKPAKQRGRGTANTADMAVDVLGTKTCARTPPNVTGWWRLNLEYQATISRIKLTADVGTSLRDWIITISNYDSFPTTPPCTTIRRHSNSVEISCDVMQSGRYITVFNRHGAVRLCNFEVYSCSVYTFGPNCSSTCRCVDSREVCNNVDGHCRSGCASGWTGHGCDRECPGHTYGPQCQYICGHCRNGLPCGKVTGTCRDGCDLGWMNEKCNEECFPGTYGVDCRTLCGHCLQGSWCHHKTGVCLDGCRNGWSGPHCNITCPPLKYGENCALDCGHCMNGTKCHDETGICNKGCDAGWKSLFCKQECLPGSYGFGCKQRCDNCYDQFCDRFFGICNQGCAPGWVGRDCQLNCLSDYYGDGCQERCGLCKDGGVCMATTGECPLGCQAGWKQGYCNETCDRGFYGESCVTECGACDSDGPVSCDEVTGICPAECLKGFSGTKCDTEDAFEDVDDPKLLTTVIVVASVVVAVLLIITVCFVLKWRRDTIMDPMDDEAVKKPLDTRDKTEADEDDAV